MGEILMEKGDGTATISLKDERGLNLIDRKMLKKFEEMLDELAADSAARVVVIRGHGDRVFSAGVDLREMKDFSPLDAEDFISSLHSVIKKIMELPQPVIASIRGPCLGGAFEMVLGCDIRIAAEDAIFGLPEIKVGIPSVIEASLLPLFIGLGRARKMILSGENIDARNAFEAGIVDAVVPPDELDAKVMREAGSFFGLSPYILRVQKEILMSWLKMAPEAAAEFSVRQYAQCFATSHPREGMEAFLEKREPRYSALPEGTRQ